MEFLSDAWDLVGDLWSEHWPVVVVVGVAALMGWFVWALCVSDDEYHRRQHVACAAVYANEPDPKKRAALVYLCESGHPVQADAR